jgi:hypothetical protein
MSTVTQFKCPNCSAELTFNPDKQNFGCEYCRGEFTEKQLLEFQKKMEEAMNSEGLPQKGKDYQKRLFTKLIKENDEKIAEAQKELDEL